MRTDRKQKNKFLSVDDGKITALNCNLFEIIVFAFYCKLTFQKNKMRNK